MEVCETEKKFQKLFSVSLVSNPNAAAAATARSCLFLQQLRHIHGSIQSEIDACEWRLMWKGSIMECRTKRDEINPTAN